MNSSHELLLTALIATFAIFHLVQAQEQEGFISLDCGLAPTEPSPYTEPVTTLQYSSDSNFIQSGKLGRIDTSLQTFNLKQQTTLRYFPDGIRNCYNLTVKQGTNYLIRAWFTYGNYDGLHIYPTFDLYLGPNFWIRIGQISTLEEITYIPLSNSLDVCLVKTNTSIPFISALELRPLPSNSYITTAGSLKTYGRMYFRDSEEDIRFPMDVHDRMWTSGFEGDWTQISTSLTVNTSDSFRLPQAALITAATLANDSAPIIDFTFPTFSEERIFIYLHFSEVQALRANETREFNISINGESVADLYRPVYLQSKTVNNKLPIICENMECLIELSRTQSSTHPPMINAIEIFLVSELLQSETYENDVIAIKKIKDTYGLQLISWQGDPCVPRLYKWDGLDCTDTDTYIAPRITSLKLSSKGLTGTIAADIQYLTSLEKLDLSNNKLVGVVPEFLANMKSLMFINLTKNDLHGSIPQALRDREKKGLKILFDGDKNDPCLSTSCNPKKKFSVMIVAIVASTVVFVLVVSLALFFGLRKKKTSSHVKAIPPSPTTPLENVMSTSISETSIEMKRKKFSYSEVMKMTNNFQRALGEGGFGTVYHGDLDSSQQVAVKLLSQSSTQGYKEFKAEENMVALS
ncbi:unnamed protein product [Arabidopsis thaliana]|uniref:(thale cress) hypothetical protein n=1 Tax=Arabidopsis thaliana TaxID=3702 RepID=A0A7G2EP57_ARATH|nr:unnamed protein product [Arabidopsis thaliana]